MPVVRNVAIHFEIIYCMFRVQDERKEETEISKNGNRIRLQ